MRTIKDLADRKVGYLSTEEPVVQLVYRTISEQLMTRFTAVALGPDEIAGALKDGKVDALYMLEPWRSYMVQAGDTVLAEGFISRYISPTMPYGAVVMKNSFVRKNRLVAFRLKNSVDAALGYLRVHPEAGKAMLVSVKKWSGNGVLLMNMRAPEYERLSEIDTKSIESYQSFLMRNGIAVSEIRPLDLLFEKTDFAK
jgi:ABC-type nitrate/sulfonate/bicarbonate transport system substrate-binding protein